MTPTELMELRLAAHRILARPAKPGAWVDDRGFPIRFAAAAAPLVLRYSDATPVTRPWICGVLPRTNLRIAANPAARYVGKFGRINWDGSEADFAIDVNGMILPWQTMVRGEFRRLCDGLGIPLTEGKR